jgi:uncharacterized protein with PQ loop repeat
VLILEDHQLLLIGGFEMNRDEVAKKIRWKPIIWLAGLVNVTAMLLQLLKILTTWNVERVSLGMFVIYFCIQAAFSLEGYFKRNEVLMWCLGASALISTIIISLILYIRYVG